MNEVQSITCAGSFETADDARRAAARLLIDAEAFEISQAEAAGLRVFDCPWGRHTYTWDGAWWIGEQTASDGEVRLFATPTAGPWAFPEHVQIGTRWGSESEFTHVIVARGTWVSSFERDGIPYQRYIELSEPMTGDLA